MRLKVLNGTQENGLYRLTGDLTSSPIAYIAAAPSPSSSFLLWHRRLGHASTNIADQHQVILSPSIPVATTSNPIKEHLEPSLAQGVTNQGNASETTHGEKTLSPGAGSPPPSSNQTRSNQCCESVVPGMAHSPILKAPILSEAPDPGVSHMTQPLIPSTQMHDDPEFNYHDSSPDSSHMQPPLS
ncbi:hypothetical protein V6N12_029042 [Hibiscus sabdariffa]|uniref:GAG-pre-integrase domain-containing protein n=1 Tax=Hibiscus sabdariffa TaxID=183260 RepID=A0ABR2F7K3_9ROSI